ncbi:hypothetical protein GCM10027517_39120 [Phycicoccus ginsengisoli]
MPLWRRKSSGSNCSLGPGDTEHLGGIDDLAALLGTAEGALQPGVGRRNSCGTGFDDDHVEARAGADLDDARPHEPASDDPHPADRAAGAGEHVLLRAR